MSSNITQKLWSHLRDPVSHLMALKPSGFPRQSAFSRSFSSQNPRRAFSWSRPRIQPVSSKRSVSKSFASCGFLFIDVSSSTTPKSSTLAACTTNAEKCLYTSSKIPRPTVTPSAQQAWRRQIHSSSRRRERGVARRNKSSSSNEQNARKPIQSGNNTSNSTPITRKTETPVPESKQTTYLHLPQMHRPTKEELLAAATGFWSRLKVRFKWFSIRSSRPWNIDDWSAFVSWFVLGNIVWVLVGTTTFFSLVILSINTVVAQGVYRIFQIELHN